MQAPDATVARGPITLSIRKRSGRTISAIVERGASSLPCIIAPYEHYISSLHVV
jgi:hypothetical protein